MLHAMLFRRVVALMAVAIGLVSISLSSSALAQQISFSGPTRYHAFARSFQDCVGVLLNTTNESDACAPPDSSGVSICSPTNGSTVSSPVQISAKGGSNITWMEAWIDGVRRYSASGNTVDFSVALSDGAHSMNVYGKQNGTVADKQSVNFTVTSSGGGDCSAPGSSTDVVVCSPTSGSTVSSPVQVSAEGGSAITWMEVWIDGARRYSASGNTVELSVSLSAGAHSMNVYGKQNGTVADKQSVSFTVSGGGECTAPASAGVNICTPENGSSVTSPVHLVAAITVNGTFTGAWVQVDGSNEFHSDSADIDTNLTIPSGTHTIQVKGWNSAGATVRASVTVTASVQTSSGVNVLTWHNDAARTGANTQETILTPANVNSSTFGKLFQLTVDGDVQAQPLYVSNLLVNGQSHNVVFIATQNDVVYAFDADNGASLWQRSFIVNGATVPTAPVCCPNHPGITGTPVIDLNANSMYLVARTVEGGKDVQRLYALDISTGQVRNSAVINPTIPGKGDANQTNSFCPVQSDTIIFCNPTQNQRPGLLIADGLIWVMYASHSDKHPYHGWVLAYDSSLKPVVVWNATPNGQGGGIWMSGAAPAADANGNIYFATGNGPFDPNNGNYGQAWIKMSGTGVVLSFFSPYNWDALNAPDLDLGSGGGSLILPDQAGPDPHLLVGVDKNGTIYLLDRDNMGGHDASDNSNVIQTICDAFPGRTDCTTIRDAKDIHLIRSSPAYWNGFVYFAGQNDVIKAFQLTNGKLSTKPVSQGSITMGFPGSTISISANGNSNGIAWLIDNKSSGVLRAYDATDVSKELYNSASSRDTTGSSFTRFVVPTIANGKVYVPTVGHVTVYGLLANVKRLP